MKRPQYIAFGLVVLLTLILLNLPSHAAAKLKLAIGSLFLPLLGLASAAQPSPLAANNPLPVQQAELLRRENQELKLRLAQTQELARENDRLRQLFGWPKQANRQLKLARVVLREPANWWRSVQIDFGSRDGARVNQPVLAPEGLIGRISSVSFDRSQVVLLGDPSCRVSALVEGSTRDQGIIASGASGPLDDSLVTLTYLPQSAEPKPGQSVVTSGLGGIFPKGIVIGKVVDSRPVEYGLYKEARVKLGANLSALEEVWVLVQ